MVAVGLDLTKMKNISRFILCLFAVIYTSVLSSCAKWDKDFDSLITDAYKSIEKENYEEAQLKALEAKGLLKDDSPLEFRESLARLYGVIYFQQNVRNKAQFYLRQALACASEMKDTSLIITNRFNLGLCATTSNDALFNFEQAAILAQKIGNKPQEASIYEKLAQVYISTKELLLSAKLFGKIQI